MVDNRIKVVISKVGMDGHEVGPMTIARWMRDAGMEVIYLGRFQTPEGVVQAAMKKSIERIILQVSRIVESHELEAFRVPSLMAV